MHPTKIILFVKSVLRAHYMFNYQCLSPILLLTYKRIDTTMQVFAQIQKVQPKRLYIASNYPKNSDENDKVFALRKLLEQSIDWECQVYTLYRESHLSAKISISSAISWFFEHEEQGIILEDDCLPTLSFFRFCDELLERYRDKECVMMISGWSALDFAFNPSTDTLCPKARLQEDYYFSKYNHIWGWASWARSWRKYERESSDFTKDFAHFDFNSKLERRSWRKIFGAYYGGKIDTWDYPWTFSIWKAHGLCVYPKNNMVKNIGFNRDDAAHTQGDSKFATMPSYEIAFPLSHPKKIAPNTYLDAMDFAIAFNQASIMQRIKTKCKKVLSSIIH